MASHETAECPHCSSRNTVQTGRSLLKTMHFCFACGKAFEKKTPQVAEA
jgi:hypothetical protein